MVFNKLSPTCCIRIIDKNSKGCYCWIVTFQKKTVKKTKHLIFTCFFKGLQIVELKKDEKNGILPTNNDSKWFIKKQITKCRKSYLGYLCSVSTYPFVIFSATQPNRSHQDRTNSTRNRPPQHTINILRWSVCISWIHLLTKLIEEIAGVS